MKKCKNDPWYFMTCYVFTLDRSRGILQFPDWPFLKDFCTALQNERFLVVLKARQMMFTWTATAFVLWESVFCGNSDTILISRRSAEAKELLRRIFFIYRKLPDFMRPEMTRKTGEVIEFGLRQSRILSVPATPDTGRTYSPKRVIWDEMAFTPFSDEIYSALKPGLDREGSFVGISSPNGPFTKHGRLCLDADKQGFKLVKAHWSDHPERGEDWLKTMKKGMSGEQWKREYELDLSLGGKRIYEKFSGENIIDSFTNYREFRLFRTIDFGFRTPVCLWFCFTPEEKLVFFYEWIGCDNTTVEMREKIRVSDGLLGINEEDIEMTFCDPAGAAKTDEGISAVEKLQPYIEKIFYRKSNVLPGIDLVREYISAADGERRLQITSNCIRLISDFRQYSRKDNSEDPKKDGISDHTMDALRYAVVGLSDCSELPPEALLKGLVSGSKIKSGRLGNYAAGQQSIIPALYNRKGDL